MRSLTTSAISGRTTWVWGVGSGKVWMAERVFIVHLFVFLCLFRARSTFVLSFSLSLTLSLDFLLLSFCLSLQLFVSLSPALSLSRPSSTSPPGLTVTRRAFYADHASRRLDCVYYLHESFRSAKAVPRPKTHTKGLYMSACAWSDRNGDLGSSSTGIRTRLRLSATMSTSILI